MKKLPEVLRYWLFPEIDAETGSEMDALNLTNIYYVSLIICVVQAVSLAVYFAANLIHFGERGYIVPMISSGGSVAICFAACMIAAKLRRAGDLGNRRTAVKVFTGVYFGIMIISSMLASARTYVHGEQVITFYAIQICVVLFVKLRPTFTVSMILSSYTVFFVWFNFFLIPGKINAYNFITLALISAAGAVINYRLTVSHIQQRNRAEKLNKSLEIIANHDSATGLQNRYALNNRISGCLNRELCVAMGDINSFKLVNDTYGHHMGDVMLKRFAELLRRYFPEEALCRYGGDEFLIVYESKDLDSFKETLDKINSDFAAMRPNGFRLELGCSFGCASGCPKTIGDLFNMILRADQSLYAVKRGKNR